jgi:hypothetical protein
VSAGSTRFDAEEYVTAWVERGDYPKIHVPITAWVRENVGPEEGHVLDLCSSTGLLGRKLAQAGYRVRAVEQPGPGLELGRQNRVYEHIPLMPLKIGPDTLDDLAEWLSGRLTATEPVRTVVARRAFPELWDAMGGTQKDFACLVEVLRASGVRNILLEGRQVSKRSTHPLASAADEARALGPSFKAVAWRGPLYHLVASG